MTTSETENRYRFSATPAEREIVAQLGEVHGEAVLGISRSTLARIGAGYPLRESTLELFRARIREHEARIAAFLAELESAEAERDE